MKKREYLKEILVIAEKNNVKLLSLNYLNSKHSLQFECNVCKKKFKDYRENILKKNKIIQCPYCVKARYFQQLKQIVELKGGKLLSKNYHNAHTKVQVNCNKGHKDWWIAPYSLKQGHWCPECSINQVAKGNLKYSVEDLNLWAMSKPGGGRCLSKNYSGMNKHHKWECGICGNIWTAKPIHIKGSPSKPEGSWCPKCNKGISERICRMFFESIFNKKFRLENTLNWLKKRKMHLDGYNSDLKIAFEYQGIQHYKFHSYYHRNNEENFIKQLKDDQYKRKICKRDGIILIEIGYEKKDGKWYKINYDEMEDYIRKKCEEKGIACPQRNSKIDWRNFDVAPPNYYQEIKQIVERKGGKLISPFYLGNNVKLLIKCGKDHEWWVQPHHLKDTPLQKGSWCPYCFNNRRGKRLL